MNKKTFYVTLFELHYSKIEVEAESQMDAVALALSGEGDEVDYGFLETAELYRGKDLPAGVRSVEEESGDTGLFSGGPMRELDEAEQAAFDAIIPKEE